MLETLSVVIENTDFVSKRDELFQIGVPFPQAQVLDAALLVLIDKQQQQPLAYSYQVLAYWPDQSIKFLLVTFTSSLAPSERRELGFTTKADLSSSQVSVFEQLGAQATGFVASFNEADSLRLPKIESAQGVPALALASELSLNKAGGERARLEITQSEQLSVQEHGFSHFINKQEGEFKLDEHKALRFISQQEFIGQTGVLKWQFTLWNPNAAAHPGGCWDLGDPGSILFESLDLQLRPEATCYAQWRLTAEEEFKTCESTFSITQSGSACPIANLNAQSFNRNIHKNAQGDVPTFFNGCELKLGEHMERLSVRAAPEVFFQAKDSEPGFGLLVSLAEFWQNFPKAFTVNDAGLTLSLFPKQGAGELFELQAGERKTHTFYIQLSTEKEHLAWVNCPSAQYIDPNWLAKCALFPFFPEQAVSEEIKDPLAPFIGQGLEGDHTFEAKREKIDEYGWRNFGDVYADHETLYQKPGEQAFVSHYNNQYDAIYGFARQYAQTGDMRWFKLMDELARHVVDIDIYHTESDRVEYNNGLFWHTDHYLDAQTCTHRTFSKHNQTSSTPGQTGGGPGTEHCYTTGLLYHYWFTGSERSKESVLKLANWMIASHEGAKSFLAQVLSAKNKELPKLIASLKGQTVSPYYYPFTRGTGNFMVALIDAFQLSGDVYYLSYLESVIKNTLHPKDDISMRNLHDIENTWSYVVLLQALAKYLSLKEELNQGDKAYAYARQSFMHYAKWMLENETPYLSRTEILEFPNDTWVAQELRKVSIWISASKYSAFKTQEFKEKAKELLNYIVTTLEKSPEKQFSRIQILLLQSYGPHMYCNNKLTIPQVSMKFETCEFGSAPKASVVALGLLILKKLVFGLRFLSPKNERQWISTRRS